MLGDGLEMVSAGKLSLQAYGALLNQCAIGISLMLSPHPSYPPLEMAHSGILTITNSFAEKIFRRGTTTSIHFRDWPGGCGQRHREVRKYV